MGLRCLISRMWLIGAMRFSRRAVYLLKLRTCDCNFGWPRADLEEHLRRCDLRLFRILFLLHDYAVSEVLYGSVAVL